MFRLSHKLLLALVIMMLLMLVPSVLAVLSLRRLAPITEDLLRSIDLTLDQEINKVSDCERIFVVFHATGEKDVGELAENCADAFWAATDELVSQLEPDYPEEAGKLQAAAQLYAEYSTQRKLRAEQEESLPPREATQQRLLEMLRAVQKKQILRRRDLALGIEEAAAKAIRNVAVFAALGAVLAFGITSLLTRQVVVPVRRLLRATRKVAVGRFEAEVPASSRDEIGELTRAFNRMNHDLAVLDRMRAEFIHVASHELKSPAATIRLYLELLRDKPDLPDEERRSILTSIGEESDLLVRYIDQFMDISRMETGRLNYEPDWIPAVPFFSEQVEAFRAQAEQLGIELVLDVEEGLPDDVRIDADRIGQVLRNILENAFQHTPEGGRITTRLEPADEVDFILTVSDSGPGVQPGEEERIFEKYVRGSVERLRGGKGSGLGLAIARVIVEGHGGKLWVERGEAGGAVFRCRLPVRGPAAARTE